MNLRKKISLLLVLILVAGAGIFAQPDTLATQGTEINPPEPVSTHSLFAGAGIGSNMIYLGSTISQDNPYEFASLTYGFKDKLYASVSGVHLGKTSPFIAFYTIGLNYNQVINSWFDISGGISRYQVAPSLTDTLFSNFNYADLTAGFDWKILYTKLSLGGIIADGASPYFQIGNSRYFQTPEFGNKKLTISFNPYFNLLFGKLTTAETSSGKTITSTPPFRTSGTGGSGTGGSGSGGSTGSSTNTIYTTTFGLMEADFGMTLSFNAPKFTIEADPGYALPLYEDPEYPGAKGFVMTVSCYFRIF